jgi:hypothetical protein
MPFTLGPPKVTVEELSASDKLEFGKTHLGKPTHTEEKKLLNQEEKYNERTENALIEKNIPKRTNKQHEENTNNYKQ